MKGRRTKMIRYTVEFSARTRTMIVNGAKTVQVKHWTRAREATKLRLERRGFTAVRCFRPHQLFVVSEVYDTSALAF